MSSNAEHEPLEQNPAERRLQWRLDSDVRRIIRLGMDAYGEDEFLAYLSLNGVNPYDPRLLEHFEDHYFASYDDVRELCDFVLGNYRRAGISIQDFIVESQTIPGELEIDYGLVEEDIRRHLRLTEMGGRIHAFARR